ncbi:Ig-like domain-containing protein [Candidatus Margulisiibacteriota bacterium]
MVRKIHRRSTTFGSLIIILIIGVFLYITNTGCGSGVTGGGTPTPNRIGPAGGTITYKSFTMIVPPGALTTDVLFTADDYSTSESMVVTGSAYSVGPSGTIFLVPAIINISYDSSTPSTVEATYLLGTINNDVWYGIGGTTAEAALNIVSGETNSLSIYGIVTSEISTVGSLEIVLSQPSTQVAIGETFQLTAEAYDDDGTPQPGWVLDYDWASTIPSIVSVDNTGLIRGENLGVATVHAYATGKQSNGCTVTSGDLNVASIEVTPVSASLVAESQQQFSATPKNAAEQTIPSQYVTLTWHSDDTNIATIGLTSGLATAVSAGACSIFASSEGVESNYVSFEVIDLPDWSITTPDADYFACFYTSIALDTSNNQHISYYDAGGEKKLLKYVSYNGSSWGSPTIVDGEGDTGLYSSLAMDGDYGRISYYDSTNGLLRYASWEGEGMYWAKTTVEVTSNDVGRHTSLALYNGNPRISYYDATAGSLKYASYEAGTWYVQTVDSGGSDDVGLYTSLALDSSGNPRISYYNNTTEDLEYAYHNGTSWQYKTIDPSGDVGLYTSLALDGSNNPRISYYYSTGGDLKYASCEAGSESGSWNIATIDSVGTVGDFTSLALDSSGNPRISYRDNTLPTSNEKLKYAWYQGSTWYTMVIEAGNAGRYSSMTIDGSNKVSISYYADYGQLLRCAEQN